jgi:cell shape-determining protein MreC
MKAILFVVIFAVVKIAYVWILKFLMLGWFTVTIKFMGNVLSNVPDCALILEKFVNNSEYNRARQSSYPDISPL